MTESTTPFGLSNAEETFISIVAQTINEYRANRDSPKSFGEVCEMQLGSIIAMVASECEDDESGELSSLAIMLLGKLSKRFDEMCQTAVEQIVETTDRNRSSK